MKQYELRWADLPLPAGRRPVLLLSRTPAYGYLTRVIVAEVGSRVRGIPQEVPIGTRAGLPRASVANLDNLHVVDKVRLGELIGEMAPARVREVKRALGYALDWPELKIL